MMLLRWIWRALPFTTIVAAVGSLVLLMQNPFTEPYVLRTKAEAELALDSALRKQMTPGWVASELDLAVEHKNLDRVEILLELIGHHQIEVDKTHKSRAREFVDREKGIIRKGIQCSACIVDVQECKTPTVFLFCNMPVEVTLIGDVRTLAEAGSDVAMGNPVDQVDVSLAVIGIGASALSLLTGGSSYTIKVGATVIRVARKMGILGQGLGQILTEAARTPIRWDKIDEFVVTKNLGVITDPRPFKEIGEIARNLGTISEHANKSDAIFLLKHINNQKDAVALARISEVAGKRTRGTVEVLGMVKTVAVIKRLSNITLMTIGFIVAFVGQLLTLVSPLCLGLLRRIVRHGRRND